MKKYTFFFMLILSFSLNALTLEWGNFKIKADEKTGGFQIFSRISQDSPWRSLLVESFTSSYLELSLDGEEIILNGNRDYTVRFEQTETRLSIIFESKDISSEQRIQLQNPKGGIPYLVLTDRIMNNSSEQKTVGLKRVLDTAFIRENTHYLVQGKSIEEETLFTGENIPELILSRGKDSEEKLYIDPKPVAAQKADRVLMGNWNRIDKKNWDYIPPGKTNFNSLPFSINDSALAFYRLPESLAAGSSLSLTLALGSMDFTGQEIEETPVQEGLPETAADFYPKKNSSLALLHLTEQLEYLNNLIIDIDRLIKKGQDVSNDEIKTVENRLEILEQKKREYEEIQ